MMRIRTIQRDTRRHRLLSGAANRQIWPSRLLNMLHKLVRYGVSEAPTPKRPMRRSWMYLERYFTLFGRMDPSCRRRWPRTRVLLRDNFGFCREALMAWCEANRMDYVFGLTGWKELVAQDRRAWNVRRRTP